MGRIMLATSNSTDEEYGGIIEEKYSTTEQVVGKWIDGSALYRKVFNITSASAGDNNIPHNITNLDKVVKIDSTFSAWEYNYVAPLVSSDTANSINLTIGSNNIIATVGANIAGSLTRLIIILTYTKSA